MKEDADLARMTRSRLYVLIDAFEADIRAIIRRHITSVMSVEDALGDLYNKAEKRRAVDEGASDDTDAADYLDLMEAYDVLNRHRRLLPEELAVEVRKNTTDVPRLVDARKRVMHPRPLLSDDAMTVTILLGEFRTQWWPELQRVSSHLRADDAWEPIVNLGADPSLTLHNLPLPDYDETGLLGRDDDVSRLMGLLKRKREPVITITGEGGIGKTAIALFVAYRLVDDPSRPYDAILWVSLKHEKLTAVGIRSITGAVRDIQNSATEIGKGLEASFSGTLGELGEALAGVETLIVLDNLETISGDEFGIMYNTLPDSVRYLITSRVGLGQYERRYPLAELSESAALKLLNEHIKFRRLHPLAKISGETRKQIVQRLRYSPLAIIWFVLAVEAGREPVALLREQGELLEFCVRSVYDGLSSCARDVLDALAVIGRPAGPDELVVITDGDVDGINQGVQELERGSLVRREAKSLGADLRMIISPTETASAFLEKRVVLDPQLSTRISGKERHLRLNEERRLNDVAARSLDPVVIHTRGAQDTAAAYLLRQALLRGRDNDLEGAADLLTQARRLSPDFWEVDRVEAFLRIYANDYAGANTSYQAALNKSAETDRGIVAYFYSNHISKNLSDPAGALEYATMAHELLNVDETALGLGNMLVRNRQFQPGLELIKPVLARAEGRLRVIALDAYTSGLRRWAEWSGREERNPAAQFRLSAQATEIALDAMEAGIIDEKLRNTACRNAKTAIDGARMSVSQSLAPKGLDAWIERITKSLFRFVGTPDWLELSRTIAQLQSSRIAIAGVQRLAQQAEDLDRTAGSPISDGGGRMIGEVAHMANGFGFLRHPRFPNNIFFHRDDCDPPEAWEALAIGHLAEFEACDGDRGPRALNVRPTR